MGICFFEANTVAHPMCQALVELEIEEPELAVVAVEVQLDIRVLCV